MRGAALYQQSGELSGPCLRPIGKPRSSRADRAKARDVRKTSPEVGTSARHAAIRRDAPLSVLVQVRAGRPIKQALRCSPSPVSNGRSRSTFRNLRTCPVEWNCEPVEAEKEPAMKVLMVLSSHDKLGDTGRKTGFWLEELAAPYYEFKNAG